MVLDRQPTFEETTLGSLFIEGAFFCATLEDAIREEKLLEKTAIPPGRYRVIVTLSNRFGCRMPLLAGVPGYQGIRIHPGNTAEDTSGCILVGRVEDARTIVHSRAIFDMLFPLIIEGTNSGVGCWINVRNPG